jgi:hypothetical protein
LFVKISKKVCGNIVLISIFGKLLDVGIFVKNPIINDMENKKTGRM